MNILLTGSDGQLGRSLTSTLPKNINLIQTNKNDLDICNNDQIFNTKFSGLIHPYRG